MLYAQDFYVNRPVFKFHASVFAKDVAIFFFPMEESEFC